MSQYFTPLHIWQFNSLLLLCSYKKKKKFYIFLSLIFHVFVYLIKDSWDWLCLSLSSETVLQGYSKECRFSWKPASFSCCVFGSQSRTSLCVFVRCFVVQGLDLFCATEHTLCKASSLAEIDINVFLSITWPWLSWCVRELLRRPVFVFWGCLALSVSCDLDAWLGSYTSRDCPCVEHICSNAYSLRLGLATAAAGHAGQHCHEHNNQDEG